jgi:hypothetical protein
MKIETDSANPFLDVLVIYNENQNLEQTHSHRTLPPFPFESSTTREKKSCAESIPQNSAIYQEQQVRSDEIFTLKLDLQPIALGFCYQQTQEKCSSEEGAATLFYTCTLYKRCLLEVQTHSELIQY